MRPRQRKELAVLHEDNHLLIIDKPAGMPSQPDRTGDPDVLTLGKALIKERYNKPGAVFLGLVHRLDRPSSGVMVLARTSKSASRLSEQFRDKTIRKTYLALLEGVPEEGAVYQDWLIKEYERVKLVPQGTKGAKKASLKVIKVIRFGALSLVQVELETGRSHQIRIQFSERGHPLVGDFRYRSRRELDGRNLALHAGVLEFNHPTKKDRLRFATLVPSTWPEDVQEAGNRLLGM